MAIVNPKDPSVIDYQEIVGITCDGDQRITELVLSYDLSDGTYTVEKFRDGNTCDYECYGSKFDAQLCFSRWVNETEKDYEDDLKEFGRWVLENQDA